MQAVIDLIKKYLRIVRFIIAGGTGAVVNLVALYIVVHYFGLDPTPGSVVSFLVAFFVSFALQKLWTYKNYNKTTAGHQMATYFAVQLVNLGINAGLMYLLTTYTPLHYLAAQVLISGMIAIESFLVYKHFVFKETPPEPAPS